MAIPRESRFRILPLLLIPLGFALYAGALGGAIEDFPRAMALDLGTEAEGSADMIRACKIGFPLGCESARVVSLAGTDSSALSRLKERR